MFIARCDYCKQKEKNLGQIQAKPEGWLEVGISIPPWQQTVVGYVLCPECCQKLGLQEPQIKCCPAKVELAGRLLEIIEEIVNQRDLTVEHGPVE